MVGDLLDPITGEFLPREILIEQYQVDIAVELYTELKYIVNSTKRSLDVTDTRVLQFSRPYQPLLVHTLNLVNQGCSTYYRILRKSRSPKISLARSEEKWHQEINMVLSVQFWSQTYINTANIKNNNKYKWFQFQINRNILFTNYRVNKFKPYISPYCSFCTHSEEDNKVELVSHLFYDCKYSLSFWTQVKAWLATIPNEIDIPLDKKEILFGIPNQASNPVPNFIISCGKYYIWKVKKQGSRLCVNGFKTYLKYKLAEIKRTLMYEEKGRDFVIWSVIFDYL